MSSFPFWVRIVTSASIGLLAVSVAAVERESGVAALRYPLERQFIRQWLVAGPQVSRVEDVSPFQGANDDETKRNVLRHFRREGNEVTETPREGTALNAEKAQFPWKYFRTADDRAVAFSQGGGCVYLKAWAYAQVESTVACRGEWQVAAHGPVEVWVNGERVLQRDALSTFVPLRHKFGAALRAGSNEVLVRFEVVKIRVGVFGMGLKLPDQAAGAQVVLPTMLPESSARLAAEQVVEAGYLDRETFAGNEAIAMRWSDELPSSAPLVLELKSAGDTTIARKEVVGAKGATVDFGVASAFERGRYTIRLVPSGIRDPRVRDLCAKSLAFMIRGADAVFATRPVGTYEERRSEILERASRQSGLNAEIAKMALGRWADVQVEPFLRAAEKANRRQDTSDFEMAAIAGAMLRYGKNTAFPNALRQPLEQCVLGFKYWADEPGKDVMWYWSENHQITFHAAEIMAGQLYPVKTFTNAGQTGHWHREKGERLALTWLRKRAAHGFHEWDSNTYFYIDLLALSHLADLAENADVHSLASVVLTKMLFTIALNSFQGVFGSAHARTYPGDVKSGRGEGTSGASYLMWGLGSPGFTSLALMKRNPLPPVIAKIATATSAELWNRERHGGTLDPAADYFGGAWEVNKVTYKTPDFMLCSAQDYRAGGRGNMQHIWQATFGPDAPVFVNHPPFIAESGSPNLWVGNLVLPRVAQWKDVLIDVRNDAKGEGMGFTHAYFPLAAFDEWELAGRWIFARKGDGYIALTSEAGPALLKSGRYAFREIRSHALQDIWVCHLGSKRQDGSFAAFREKISRMPLSFDGLTVKLTSLRGDELAFGWTGPFLRNGEVVPLRDFPHYDNPFCRVLLPASRMTITCGAESVDLTWRDGPAN